MFTINNMPPEARVWVHQSTREITPDEVTLIEQAVKSFVKEWAAHGSSLNAGFDVLYNRFIVISVDESQAGASGCSIDSSIKFLKEIAAQFNLELFDRMNVAYRANDNTVKSCDLPDFKKLVDDKLLNNDTFVFNNMITNKKSFDSEWELPLKNRCQASFMN
jgi:hypothetical protein